MIPLHSFFQSFPCTLAGMLYLAGDCCECTCVDTSLFVCGNNGFSCTDPDAPCYDPNAATSLANCTGSLSSVGNGYCDIELNNQDCEYDGGKTKYFSNIFLNRDHVRSLFPIEPYTFGREGGGRGVQVSPDNSIKKSRLPISPTATLPFCLR